MDRKKLKYQIFDLTPEKFEELCHLLLKAEFEFDKAFILDITSDEGVDILAYKGIEKIAVSVKHKYQIDKSVLQPEIERLNKVLEYYHKIIFITSAIIDKKTISDFETDKISIISQGDLIKLLDKHADITKRYFKIVAQKNKSIRKWFTSSIAGVLISVFASIVTFMIDKKDVDKPLSHRIENVEQALKNIQGLEKDLEGIKDDMIKTDIENKRILEEYEKMQGLEEIINEKKESLQLVLNYQPWYKRILNYFLGLVTGISSSIIASILWSRWKLKKSLKE